MIKKETMDNPFEAILKFFEYKHLPLNLQHTSQQFHALANNMVLNNEPSAELAAGLRKLLEAKDCFVRAAMTK